MAPARVVEAVDVFEHRDLDIPACLPCVLPDQLGLEGFEEALDSRIIKAISFAAHRRQEFVTTKTLLVLVGTVLRTTIHCPAGYFRRK